MLKEMAIGHTNYVLSPICIFKSDNLYLLFSSAGNNQRVILRSPMILSIPDFHWARVACGHLRMYSHWKMIQVDERWGFCKQTLQGFPFRGSFLIC